MRSVANHGRRIRVHRDIGRERRRRLRPSVPPDARHGVEKVPRAGSVRPPGKGQAATARHHRTGSGQQIAGRSAPSGRLPPGRPQLNDGRPRWIGRLRAARALRPGKRQFHSAVRHRHRLPLQGVPGRQRPQVQDQPPRAQQLPQTQPPALAAQLRRQSSASRIAQEHVEIQSGARTSRRAPADDGRSAARIPGSFENAEYAAGPAESELRAVAADAAYPDAARSER